MREKEGERERGREGESRRGCPGSNGIPGSSGIRTHDHRDTGAMLYRLSYKASPEAGQVRVHLYQLYEENDEDEDKDMIKNI